MREEFFILTFFTLICTFIMVFYVTRRWFAMREKRLEIEAMQVAEKTAQYVADSKAIDERLAVLEKIVTDDGYDTAAQIEALRRPRLSAENREPREIGS